MVYLLVSTNFGRYSFHLSLPSVKIPPIHTDYSALLFSSLLFLVEFFLNSVACPPRLYKDQLFSSTQSPTTASNTMEAPFLQILPFPGLVNGQDGQATLHSSHPSYQQFTRPLAWQNLEYTQRPPIRLPSQLSDDLYSRPSIVSYYPCGCCAVSNIGAPVAPDTYPPGGQMPVIPDMVVAPSHGGSAMMDSQPQQRQVKRFKCDQCVQSFERNHDLKRHKRIHLAVKPFPCPSCNKTFSRKDALKVRS